MNSRQRRIARRSIESARAKMERFTEMAKTAKEVAQAFAKLGAAMNAIKYRREEKT